MTPQLERLALIMGVIPALLVFCRILLHIWQSNNKRRK